MIPSPTQLTLLNLPKLCPRASEANPRWMYHLDWKSCFVVYWRIQQTFLRSWYSGYLRWLFYCCQSIQNLCRVLTIFQFSNLLKIPWNCFHDLVWSFWLVRAETKAYQKLNGQCLLVSSGHSSLVFIQPPL